MGGMATSPTAFPDGIGNGRVRRHAPPWPVRHLKGSVPSGWCSPGFVCTRGDHAVESDIRIFVDANNFNEERYLVFNQDVAHAVKRGEFSSGREHFEKHPHERRIIGYDTAKYVSEVGLTTSLPPPELVMLVNGHTDIIAYAASRRDAANQIIEFMDGAGLQIADFKSIYDFGCGCGRILAGFENLLGEDVKLYGSDINPDLVRFAQQEIPFAEVALTGPMPPLPYATGQFDLIYSSSVYTHMSLPAMLQWTGEIARILKPNGIAMISHHGASFADVLDGLSPEASRAVAERGYYVHRHVKENETWEGSNDYATFASSDFMRSLFKGFDLVRIYPGISRSNPFSSRQDVILFRRLDD